MKDYCESYVVHHFCSTGSCTSDLRCAPLTCVVHHGAQGDLSLGGDTYCLGLPCAPWCTTQVDGVRHRLMVPSVALYRCSSVQCRLYKPTTNWRKWTNGQTDKQTLPCALPSYLAVDDDPEMLIMDTGTCTHTL